MLLERQPIAKGGALHVIALLFILVPKERSSALGRKHGAGVKIGPLVDKCGANAQVPGSAGRRGLKDSH
jgi:hypothetical protein